MRSGMLTTASFLLATSLPALAEGDPAAGEKVFNKCKACHQVGADAKNRVGPTLNGIIGAPIAANPEFKYSDAFTAKAAEGFTWSEENIAGYIADPRASSRATR